MMRQGYYLRAVAVLMTLFFIGACSNLNEPLQTQSNGPTMLHPRLAVRTITSGLVTPTTMAFLAPDDFLVLEKNTGQVKRNVNGNLSTVLDLAVNFASERGLLDIAPHPDFPTNTNCQLKSCKL